MAIIGERGTVEEGRKTEDIGAETVEDGTKGLEKRRRRRRKRRRRRNRRRRRRRRRKANDKRHEVRRKRVK